jgi:putative selenate reductase
MTEVGATDMDTWTLLAHGQAAQALEKVSGLDPAVKAKCAEALNAKKDLRAAAGGHFDAWVSETRLLNTRHYVDGLLGTARYAAAANAKPPNKVGTKLDLFDCITCDKCVPVCPNHANFSYVLPAVELTVVKLKKSGDAWTSTPAQTLKIAKKRQFANFADFCNECGNCDVFCPEDGGPYVVKPRFFGSREQFHKWTTHDGFFVTRDEVLGRFSGQAYRLSTAKGTLFAGPGFELTLDAAKPEAPTGGTAEAGVEVDLTYFHILRWLHGALLDGPLTYVNA